MCENSKVASTRVPLRFIFWRKTVVSSANKINFDLTNNEYA